MAVTKHKLSSTATKAIVAALSLPAAALTGFSLLSRAYYRRSEVASASEIYHRISSNKKKMADAIEWDNYLLSRAEQNEAHYSLPTLTNVKVSVEDSELFGMQCIRLNHRAINDRCIIYLHGRHLSDRPSIYHWHFLDTIAKKTRAEIIVPLYPLAPVHDHSEAFEKILALYQNYLEKYGAELCTLMGDSSGAGLAAGLSQILAERKIPQPRQLILISPWLDLSLNNPALAELEAQDPMFSRLGLKKVAKLWAGEKSLTDPHLSPVVGPVFHYEKTLVFCGSRELFSADAQLFAQRLRAAGRPVELYVGKGLNNNYPLYPIPEAKAAQEIIINTIALD